jgi:hypothetical protein
LHRMGWESVLPAAAFRAAAAKDVEKKVAAEPWSTSSSIWQSPLGPHFEPWLPSSTAWASGGQADPGGTSASPGWRPFSPPFFVPKICANQHQLPRQMCWTNLCVLPRPRRKTMVIQPKGRLRKGLLDSFSPQSGSLFSTISQALPGRLAVLHAVLVETPRQRPRAPNSTL